MRKDIKVAQLIKLQDYISRYEMDISRYPAQFVRLKKQHWERLVKEWESPTVYHQADDTNEEKQKGGILFRLFRKKEKDEEVVVVEENDETIQLNSLHEIATKAELKQKFLDNLLKFQLNWASSTIAEKSFIDSQYYEDKKIRYFLQRFPDSFFVLYEPVFLLKKAPVELEVLLITPTEIWCLAFVEEEENDSFIGSKEHFWLVKSNNREEFKVLNPVMSAKRMEKIVTQLFKIGTVDLPIRKAIVSRNGYIDYPDAPDDLEILDKRSYDQWFQRMRSSTTPIKMMQLRAAKTLLDQCHTISFTRPDWNQESNVEY